MVRWVMDDNWAVYISEINGLPASFFLNLEARPDGDPDPRPYVCRLDLNLAAPSEDGLTTQEESESLLELEDELNDVTLKLYELAIECGGDYDGWETIVVRN